jgi:hypothetical protein
MPGTPVDNSGESFLLEDHFCRRNYVSHSRTTDNAAPRICGQLQTIASGLQAVSKPSIHPRHGKPRPFGIIEDEVVEAGQVAWNGNAAFASTRSNQAVKELADSGESHTVRR